MPNFARLKIPRWVPRMVELFAPEAGNNRYAARDHAAGNGRSNGSDDGRSGRRATSDRTSPAGERANAASGPASGGAARAFSMGPAHGTEVGCRAFVLSEDMVRTHVDTLFNGMNVEGVYQFRILRGEATGADWPVGRHTALARQKAWPVVRLDVQRDTPDWVVHWLQQNLGVQESVILRRPAPLGLGTLAGDWAQRTSVQHLV
jgi:polyphosphate kinase